jgi:two-component system, LuxR family, response regulator FixJ
MIDAVHRRTIFIVDDDASVRDSLALLLSLRGYATAVFASAEDFLSALGPHWGGVLVVDIRMPGMSGLELQGRIASHPVVLPVIVITGHGDIEAARQALKAKAIDFLEKPFDDSALLAAVERAFEMVDGASRAGTRPRPMTLSAREREVLALVVAGTDNRSIGQLLGISPRTVEVHKARIMGKLGARNLAELLRIAGSEDPPIR